VLARNIFAGIQIKFQRNFVNGSSRTFLVDSVQPLNSVRLWLFGFLLRSIRESLKADTGRVTQRFKRKKWSKIEGIIWIGTKAEAVVMRAVMVAVWWVVGRVIICIAIKIVTWVVSWAVWVIIVVSAIIFVVVVSILIIIACLVIAHWELSS
jgi:hypothetical protein